MKFSYLGIEAISVNWRSIDPGIQRSLEKDIQFFIKVPVMHDRKRKGFTSNKVYN